MIDARYEDVDVMSRPNASKYEDVICAVREASSQGSQQVRERERASWGRREWQAST